MDSSLNGKTALVTGASRGIGRAIARKLAAHGCSVAASYFNSHREAEALCEEIRSGGGEAFAVQANVGDTASVAALLEEVGRSWERLDVVVSNAASGVLRPLGELGLKHWRWCMEINALALPLLARHAAPLMTDGGRIVALSSLGASRALPDYGFVGASKAALEALVRSLAVELAPARIRVNAVSAGVVDTDALRAFPARDAVRAEFAARAPLGRVLEAGEVADAVYLLCLPEAEAITGQTLVVDGGYSIVG